MKCWQIRAPETISADLFSLPQTKKMSSVVFQKILLFFFSVLSSTSTESTVNTKVVAIETTQWI